MNRPLPMLAKPYLPKHDKLLPRSVVQEKFDGHRQVVHVVGHVIEAWSRTGIDCLKKNGARLQDALRLLPDGIYDGELIIPGGRCSDVTMLENYGKHVFKVFDMLEEAREDLTFRPLEYRLERLKANLAHFSEGSWMSRYVQLAESHSARSKPELDALVADIWERKGEGVIVKNTEELYYPGKRKDAFLKIKECQSEVFRIVAFSPSEGTINDRGPCGITWVEDAYHNRFSVKTLDDATCRKIERSPNLHLYRELRVEYHQRLGSHPNYTYISPRWDRFEDE